MKTLELRYIAHITTLTNVVKEKHQTQALSLRKLIDELDARYNGFGEMFVNPATGQLQLNTMIYYGDQGAIPVSVIDLDHPIKDKAIITFW